MRLIPKIEGQFANFQAWVDHADTALVGRKGLKGQDVPAVCIDARGRRCTIGAEFMRARDEGAFPIYYFWECEPVT